MDDRPLRAVQSKYGGVSPAVGIVRVLSVCDLNAELKQECVMLLWLFNAQ